MCYYTEIYITLRCISYAIALRYISHAITLRCISCYNDEVYIMYNYSEAYLQLFYLWFTSLNIIIIKIKTFSIK